VIEAADGGLDPVLLAEGESLVSERRDLTSDFLTPKIERDREICRNCIRLGLWAQTAVPKMPRKPGKPLPAGELKLDEYADAIEFSIDMLRQYREVAIALGDRAVQIAKGDEDPRTTWAGYREGYRRPGFVDVLEKLYVENNCVMVDWRTARDALRVPKQPGNDPAAAKRDVETFITAAIEHGIDNVSAAIEAYEMQTRKDREAQQRARRVAKAVARALADAEEADKDASRKSAGAGSMHYGDVLTRLEGAVVLVAGVANNAKQIPERFQPIIDRHLDSVTKHARRAQRVFRGEEPEPPAPKALNA
jgi:hypothetical protein